MNVSGAILVFEPPSWPVLFSAAAGVALAWEAMAFLRWARRGRSLAAAAGMVLVALLAGPAVGAAAGVSGLLLTAPGQPFPRKALVVACGRGTLLAALVLMAATWIPIGSILVIAACVMIWLVRSYRRTTAPIARAAKLLLLALRLAAVVLLAAWAVHPSMEYRHQKEIRGLLLVGVDTSSSMQRRDMPFLYSQGSQSEELSPRITAAKLALRDSRQDMESLGRGVEVELFLLSTSASPAGSLLSETGWEALRQAKADGPATALGDATAGAFDWAMGHAEGAASEVTGIVLLTDGCNNTSDLMSPDKAAALMGLRGVPIFTVGVGSDAVTASTRSLTVRDLAAPDEVEAFNRLPIAAAVDAIALQGKQVRVTCRFADKAVDAQTIQVDQPRQSIPIRFVHVPLASGFHRLSIEVQCVGGPAAVAGQPSASKLVHVVDRGLRVLYVEGKFRYEAKYITQALVAGQRFSVDRRILLRPFEEDPSSHLSENLDDWLAYHAIIFGDVPASRFTPKQLAIVRDLVAEYGKGFCMIGGSESFGRGGWEATPLADVLPVDLGRSEGEIPGEIKVHPTPQGASSDLMKIAQEGTDVEGAWGLLGPVTGANLLGGPKPGATVLATAPGGGPLIVVQQYGKGRSMAIAFDTTWRWVLSPKDTAAMQRRFWRQVALFLSAPKGNVWITTDKISYDLDRLARGVDAIEVSAGLEDSQGRPMTETPATVTLTAPDGTAGPVALRVEKAARVGKLAAPGGAGTYTLKIAADVGGKTLSAEHRFEIVQRDLESMEMLADFDLLRQMSQASKGEFVTLSQLGSLVGRLRILCRPKQREVIEYEDLADYNRWPLVIILISLLCVEWAIRKRRGLV